MGITARTVNFPLSGSSETALWMKATPAKLQGRVFAANSLVLQLVNVLMFSHSAIDQKNIYN